MEKEKHKNKTKTQKSNEVWDNLHTRVLMQLQALIWQNLFEETSMKSISQFEEKHNLCFQEIWKPNVKEF